ncbi:MAG: hypothetical protein J7K84_02465 [Deltaproteobacteria bacterium]|nr:hypothetical protein [Deltaproteobacteria bacterium]
MNKSSLRNLACLFIFIQILACSSYKGPSKNEIQQTLAVDLPAYIEISNFDIEASQNAGTEVNPLYQTRFRATLRLKTDTFLEHEREGNVLFVRPAKKNGESIEVFGRAESKLYAGAWQNSVKIDGSPLNSMGVPISMFNSANVIIKGTQEEEKYRAKQQHLAEKKRCAEQARFDRRKNVVLSAFSGSPVLKGEASNRKENWPFSLHVKSLDHSDGKWIGEIKWITLNAVHKVEGTIIGAKIRFVETDFIKKGNAIIGCIYTLDLDDNEIRLNGTWKCSQKGNVWINLR